MASSSELMQALRRDDASEVVRLMNSVARTRPHQKRAVKMLIESIERDKLAVTRALLIWGANVNGALRETLETPLLRAVRCSHVGATRALIEAGADANQMDFQGRAPLHEVKNCEIASLLLDAGVDIEGRDSPLWNPLSWACGRGNDQVAQLLIERGAQVEPDEDHPLFLTASRGSIHLVRVLLERGARVRRDFEEGASDALEHARKRRNFADPRVFDEIIALLEEAATRQNPSTPL